MITRRHTLVAAAAAALTPALAAAQSGPPTDDEAYAALRRLILGGFGGPEAALAVIDRLADPGWTPALILALRFSRAPRGPIEATLARLTGERGRAGWFDWMLWQEAHPELAAHPRFAALFTEAHLAIDLNFEVFLRPEYLTPERMRIRLEEIAWGGVAKDGIPSLDRPRMLAAAEASDLLDTDLVFGVEIDGDIRAYPLRILGWHEMMNDVIGGVPVALAYCTLCGAGILFETRVDGRAEPFVFGSSGFLYRSNKLMFDRQTHSLWNHFTGEPVIGPLASSGIALRRRPIVITPWSEWRAANPTTTVLSFETGHLRDYGAGVVYREYFASPDLMFPTRADPTRLAQKDEVFGVRSVGAAKAWALEGFAGGRVLNDTVGALAVVLVGDADGRTLRAYERGARRFVAGPDRRTLRDEAGARWRVTEAALIGPEGARAPRVAGHVAYWFAWDGYVGVASELWTGE